jgi:RHS repeat-associated protein
LDGNGAVLARYIHAGGIDQPLVMERGGQPYFYHRDQAGSVAALTDSGAKTICSYAYDSFGKSQLCAAVANPYGYAGREFDAESGLVYMRARYYDPAPGRFLSRDPLDLTGMILATGDSQSAAAAFRASQWLNRYSYAVNNPLRFRDPSGLRCGPIQLAPVGDGTYSVGVDLTHPNVWDVMDPSGKVVAKGQLEPNGVFLGVYDVGGNLLTQIVIKDGAQPPSYQPLPNQLGTNPYWPYADAESLAEAASRAEIYNAILDYLDPLHSRPRMVDPMADPSHRY